MSFTAQAQDLASNGDLDGLESLLDEAVAARIECRADAPKTEQINKVNDLLENLKKECAA